MIFAVRLFLFFLFLSATMSACNQDAEATANSADSDVEVTVSREQFTSFIDEMLIGYSIEHVQKLMVQTVYTKLEQQDNRINYMGVDENFVEHFVSFAFNHQDELDYYIYNLKFKNNNENLVMDYQKMMQTLLEVVYDSDFETGYDDLGHFVVDWLLEGVTVELRTGIDFITIEVRGQI